MEASLGMVSAAVVIGGGLAGEASSGMVSTAVVMGGGLTGFECKAKAFSLLTTRLIRETSEPVSELSPDTAAVDADEHEVLADLILLTMLLDLRLHKPVRFREFRSKMNAT